MKKVIEIVTDPVPGFNKRDPIDIYSGSDIFKVGSVFWS
jgi:hypothetical protein